MCYTTFLVALRIWEQKDKVRTMDNKKIDQNATIYVNNDELEKLLVAYKEVKNADALNQFLNHLVKCRILIPATTDKIANKPMPCMLRAGEKAVLLPIYTSLKHIQKAPKSEAIMNMPYLNANAMMSTANEEVKGIVINPFTDNVVLSMDMIKRIAEVEELKKKGIKQVKLTGAQYMIFERLNFEKKFLPKYLFENGEAFMQQLDDKKEVVIDELFEQSYQQKRMYPYLEEDFSVMLMTVSEDLTIARIELPAKDVGPGVAYRAFCCFNKKTKEGRYFLVDRGKTQKSRVLVEVTRGLKVVEYGEAPVDGMELQRVLVLVNAPQGLTS